MAGVFIWEGQGTLVEVPIRSGDYPFNLWIRGCFIGTTDKALVDDSTDTDNGWQREALIVVSQAVPAGDTILYASCVVSIANAHREKQGILDSGFPDTNDWGMAIDGVQPQFAQFQGPGAIELQGWSATNGNAWEMRLSTVVDLFVLREGLVSNDPNPHALPGTSTARRIRPYKEVLIHRDAYKYRH